MERHVYQWTGGRTNTGCLGTSGLEEEHTLLSRNQDSVSEWSDMSTSGLEEEHTLLSRNQDSVSEWSDMSTSELEEEQTLVVSKSG